MLPHWSRIIWQGLQSFIDVQKAGTSVYCGHISSLLCFSFGTFYMLSNGSLVICYWVFWCPGHKRLQRFDCNNKLVRSISLKAFYSFTNITLPLLRIFGEHPSISPIFLFLYYLRALFHSRSVWTKIIELCFDGPSSQPFLPAIVCLFWIFPFYQKFIMTRWPYLSSGHFVQNWNSQGMFILGASFPFQLSLITSLFQLIIS